MANILFGGPQEDKLEEPSEIHGGLIERLSERRYAIDYVTNGDDMMAGLNIHAIKELRDKAGLETHLYDVVIYDSGLFYNQTRPAKRAELFEKYVIGYLKLAQAPVIILADEEVADMIREPSQKAGFMQIDNPYNIDDVIAAVDAALIRK
jgi:hypothetical protein